MIKNLLTVNLSYYFSSNNTTAGVPEPGTGPDTFYVGQIRDPVAFLPRGFKSRPRHQNLLLLFFMGASS